VAGLTRFLLHMAATQCRPLFHPRGLLCSARPTVCVGRTFCCTSRGNTYINELACSTSTPRLATSTARKKVLGPVNG